MARRVATSVLGSLLVVGAAFGAACAPERAEPSEPDHHDSRDEPIGTARAALVDSDPVSVAVTDSCTTSSVKGLATQLIEEIQCLRPGTLASIANEPGLTLGNAVFPYLQTPARKALLDAQKQRGTPMAINSALRTLPQQYLLYRWYKTGRCGIGLAASPGKSNHEAGLAVDIEDNAGWRSAMSAQSFVWLGASDPVHYDYKGAGTVDIGGLSVLAFQKLWNRNHPEDPIAEDSSYGATTEDRLAKAPVGGFAKTADCSDAGPSVPDASVPVVDSGTTVDAAPPSAPAAGDEEGGCAVGSGRTRGTSWLGLAAAALVVGAIRRRRALRRA